MRKQNMRYSPKVRERAVQMVFDNEKDYDHQWATMCSNASKFGYTTESLRRWVRQAEIDQGRKNGLSSDESTRIKEILSPGG